MKKRTTKVVAQEWLAFLENNQEITGFGITKESVGNYKKLRNAWIKHRINAKELQQKINIICNN